MPPAAEGRLDLAIDVGNSRVALGLAQGDSWRAQWRLTTDTRRTADEYTLMLNRLFGDAGIDPASVRVATVASVVPELTDVLVEVCRRVTGCRPLVIGPGVKTGMTVQYQPALTLGSDRLADAVAARARLGAPVIAVDFGTATTFNVVSARGEFIGGAIAPGIDTAAAALASAGARLQRIDLGPAGAPPLVGRNTQQSMRAGILYGYSGLVTGLLRRMTIELAAPEPVPIVATGGRAATMAPFVPQITMVEPHLTLDGVRIIGGLNA